MSIVTVGPQCRLCGVELVPGVVICARCQDAWREIFPLGVFPNGAAPDVDARIRRALRSLDLEEADRQLVIVCLAYQSLEYPGFGWALARIAELLAGRDMFEAFRKIRRPDVAPVEMNPSR